MSTEKKIIVSEELATAYSRAKRVSIEEAYRCLEENFRKEAEQVDLQQQYHVLIKAFRDMSPKLNGVVMRESDLYNKIESLRIQVLGLQSQVGAFNERLDFEREVYKKSMIILNGIVEEDKKTMARLQALENRQPLYVRTWNKIKCWLNL